MPLLRWPRVIAALAAILWYWGITPFIVRLMARALKKTVGLGGVVSLSAASMVFLGNIEGQLVIRPYIARLNRTELFILMTVGLSVIAEGVEDERQAQILHALGCPLHRRRDVGVGGKELQVGDGRRHQHQVAATAALERSSASISPIS